MTTAYEQAVADLMQRPLGEFVTARTELSAALSARGETDAARELRATRKPSVVRWALNQAGRTVPSELIELRESSGRLRAAQEAVMRGRREGAADMASASAAQRRALDTLTRRLGMVLTAAGHAAADEALRRIGDALRNASLSGDDVWDALVAGRMMAEPAPPALPLVDGARVGPTRPAVRRVDDTLHRKRLAEAEALLDRAEDLERVAREQAAAAQKRLEDATRAVREARDALRSLQELR